MTTIAHPTTLSQHTTTAHAPGLSFTCKQEDLAHALSLVGHAVLPTSTRPILKYILLTIDQGRVRLSATTLELGIQVWIEARIDGTGIIALPAEVIRKMVHRLPGGEVTLCLQEGSQIVTLTSPGSITRLCGVDPSEFPLIPGIEPGQAPAIIEARVLKTMIDQVVFVAEKEVSEASIFSAVKLVLAEGTLTLAAAEDSRLTERIEPLSPHSGAPSADILIPARTLAKLAPLLPMQGPVHLLVTPHKNQIIFHVEQGLRLAVVSRLMNGTFPAYKKLLPTSYCTRVLVDRSALMNAVAAAAIFAVDRTRSVQVMCRPAQDTVGGGTLIIKADHTELGETVSTLAADISGVPQNLYFPVEKLQQALDHLDAAQIVLEINGSGRPVLLKPVDEVCYLSLLQTMTPPAPTI